MRRGPPPGVVGKGQWYDERGDVKELLRKLWSKLTRKHRRAVRQRRAYSRLVAVKSEPERAARVSDVLTGISYVGAGEEKVEMGSQGWGFTRQAPQHFGVGVVSRELRVLAKE